MFRIIQNSLSLCFVFCYCAILQLPAVLGTADAAVEVETAGNVGDGEDAEAGGESYLEQIYGTELGGDISSSSRDATPQQDDAEISTTNVTPQKESKEHEGALVTPDPQVALAVKIAHALVSSALYLLIKVVYQKFPSISYPSISRVICVFSLRSNALRGF